MKIKLRRYELEYAKEHCAAVKASIECLKKWFTWASPDYCLCDTIKFIEGQSNRRNEGKYDYAIIDIDDNEFLGSCGLAKVKTHNNEQIASMSYWRRQDTKKSHVMKEAWEEVESEALKLGIKRIEIDVAHCNEPSKKLLLNILELNLKGISRFVVEMAKFMTAEDTLLIVQPRNDRTLWVMHRITDARNWLLFTEPSNEMFTAH